jgi:transposase
MEANLPFGKVYGFVFILAWSRYLFVRFYPRSSMEVFLDGHVQAYDEIKGVARENWYDNLKSVIITRRPELVLKCAVPRLLTTLSLRHPPLHAKADPMKRGALNG